MPLEEKKVTVGQRQLLFFGPGTDDGTGKAVKPPHPDDVRALLKRTHPDCPFAGYIGNDAAIEELSDVLFQALGRPNHCAGPNGIALIGPPSTGKTTLARMMGKGLGTTILGGKRECRPGYFPVAECDRSIKNTEDLFKKVSEVLKQAGVPLVAQAGSGVQHYKCPPCVIYFDEAQALKGDWLLKATEREDATLITDSVVMDCRNVLWIIATTHRGKLPHAFDTRFNKVFLYPYTLEQVATMVGNANIDLDPAVCKLIASYGGRVPREALDFAQKVKLAALRLGTNDWKKVCEIVGARVGIDAEGINRQHLTVMVALCNSRDRRNKRVPVSLTRLSHQVKIEEEDLTEYVLPFLQEIMPGRPPLVRTDVRGLELTDDGLKALVARKMIRQIGPNAGTADLDTVSG